MSARLPVHFLTENAEGPSARARAQALLPGLAARGFLPACSVLPRRGRSAAFDAAAAGGAVVVLLRRLLHPLDAWRLRRRCRRLVYDFDDALPFRDSNRGARLSWTRQLKFRCLVRLADACVAGNDYLAELARGATVIPTATPLVVSRTRPFAGTLGWIGSRSNLIYLESLRPALQALWQRRQDWRIHVVCDGFPAWPELPLVRIPWQAASDESELLRFDVGLAPLLDDAWTRGKCGMKLLRYLAAGIPALASDVGVQGTFLRRGGGLLVEAGGDWLPGLLRLLDDAPLRERLTAEGPQVVAQGYLLEQAVDAWAGLLRKLH